MRSFLRQDNNWGLQGFEMLTEMVASLSPVPCPLSPVPCPLSPVYVPMVIRTTTFLSTEFPASGF